MIGRRIEIPTWDVPYSHLPEDVLQLLSPVEREAYQRGATYFKEAASRIEEARLTAVLNRLSDKHPMRVHLAREGDGPWIAWFGFTFVAESRHVSFRPPSRTVPLPNTVPDRLRRFYGALGGINDDPSGNYGILPPERITTVKGTEMHFVDDLGQMAVDCWVFHSFGNGDYMCWGPGSAGYILDHEQESLMECDLDKFLDDYFELGILSLERS